MTKFIDAQAMLSALYSQLDSGSATLEHRFDARTREHVVRLEIRSDDIGTDDAGSTDRMSKKNASLLRHLIATT